MGIPSKGGIQEMSVVSEGDIYRLIIKSKLPQAEKFESWVMGEGWQVDTIKHLLKNL